MRSIETMLTLFLSLAAASPITLAWQGRLTDVNGSPIQGDVALDLVVFDAPVNGQVTHTESLSTVSVDDGFVSVKLGADDANPLDSSDLLGGAWVQVQVDGTPIGARQELVTVPYAAVASELDGVAHLTDTDAVCDASALGTLRFRNDRFEGCTSTGWRSLVSADMTGAVGIDGPLTVGGALTAQDALVAQADTTLQGAVDVSGDLSVVGTVSSANQYSRYYEVNSSSTAPLTPPLSGSWAAVVSCAITGTTSSGSSVWLLKRSDAIYVERIASFGSTGSNTPQIYASGLDFRIKLYSHSQVYGVKCDFTEIL